MGHVKCSKIDKTIWESRLSFCLIAILENLFQHIANFEIIIKIELKFSVQKCFYFWQTSYLKTACWNIYSLFLLDRMFYNNNTMILCPIIVISILIANVNAKCGVECGGSDKFDE